jgi:hypothetical protein
MTYWVLDGMYSRVKDKKHGNGPRWGRYHAVDESSETTDTTLPI